MSPSIDVANPRKMRPIQPGDEIVISGIAGRFPDSDNVHELRDNLAKKLDMVTSDARRWAFDHPRVPQRTGKINNIDRFDALFFGVHYKQATIMDPLCRMFLEHAFEAILDAGVNPKRLRGGNTGVFVGACFSESEETWFHDDVQVNGFEITGCARAMLANRVSYYLGVTGPSYAVDTACSSALSALEQAYRAVNEGLCDSAIVASGNLCLHPCVSMQFYQLGVLSSDGRCKSFDESADGYARSEAACVVFLQRARDAKRSYATVVHAKINCDGFKEEGVTFPSSRGQIRLLEEFYGECGVEPAAVDYVEAHGTGAKDNDREEVHAIDRVLCENRSEDSPLLIGSVKSNLGHCETASGLVSIAKVIVAMETGIIPGNLHFNRCKPELKAILEGRLRVVSDCTPWKGGHAGVNSFGFGGANAHVLLRSNDKEKLDGGAPRDDLPRLVAVSGRTEQAVRRILADLESKPVDVEYVALLHNIHSDEVSGHLYRGYALLPARGVVDSSAKEVETVSGAKRPVWFVFSGMGSQWAGMGEALLRLPVFAEAIKKCDLALKPLGIDVFHLITNKDKTAFDLILNSFVGIAAVQIGLVDLLFSLGIVPDNIIGHSVGELGCAYADGCFSAEQMILSAYSRGLASIETEVVHGSMAAVGLGYKKAKDLCPPDIEVACHNSAESSTISGPAESMKEFVAQLTAKGIFAKEVPCSNIPYHSRYIAPAGPKLLAYLKKVIPVPKPRSSKWLSTSVPRDKWDTESARYSSAEYHTNNLLSPVLFEETSALIPADAIVIEIAPHGLLQAILRRSMRPGTTNIPLTKRGHRDGVEVVLQAFGKMFNAGLHPQLANLYPAVEFPVSRSTPMISPLIEWEHSDKWFVANYKSEQKIKSGERVVKINVSDSKYKSFAGHVIDDLNVLPATGYLDLIWETLGMMRGETYTELSVVFEDVRFLQASVVLPKDKGVELTLTIQKDTGRFEIIQDEVALVTGFARLTSQPSQEKSNPLLLPNHEEELMTSPDVYKELRLRGYQYAGNYRGITRASIDGSRGHIAWRDDWAAFLDNMLQMKAIGRDTRGLFVPKAIKKIVIDSEAHYGQIEVGEKEFEVFYDRMRDVIISGGVEISGLKETAVSRSKLIDKPVIEEYRFVPNADGAKLSLRDIARLCTHIAIENHTGARVVKTVEFLDEADEISVDDLLSPWIRQSLEDLPLIQADTQILTRRNDLGGKILDSASVSVKNLDKAGKANDAILVAGNRLLSDSRVDNLNLLFDELKPGGFLLSRENHMIQDIDDVARSRGLNVILTKSCERELFVLLRKREKLDKELVVIEVNDETFDWIDSVRQARKEADSKARILLVGRGDFENGLIKCLRQEPGGDAIRGILIQDPKVPPFSLENSLYAEQIQKDLVINVLRENAVWGTYRHLPLPPVKPQAARHRYIKQRVRGDLSSLTWIEGPLDPEIDKNNLARVVYASINARDAILATGKLAGENTAEGDLGLEFTGVDHFGKRIMGLLENRAMSNLCIPDEHLTWEVPETWSLEDAATVPYVYATCIYALYMKGKMKRGHKVLIHSGTSGIGQAAINLALAQGCEVFTTIGTPEKQQFIREHFPQIRDDHIGSSRDTSFAKMIKRKTNGRGVNVILNSLAEDKLRASIDCLADHGHLLQIGKSDLVENNPLGMECFLREVSFQGIVLDHVFRESAETKLELKKLVNDHLKSGAIKPITRTVFRDNQVEEAFRYMATGKHVGKVLIEVGSDKNSIDSVALALPQYYCDKNRSYAILGGLDSFGLELADWMIGRGARNLVIVSGTTGATHGYQKRRMQLWKSNGVNVTILSSKDASSLEHCRFILETAIKLAPLDGIFNFALRNNQTRQSFQESFKFGSWSTKNLDSLSRSLCPHLRHFVVFSHGRGNVEQSNYGMSNSVAERICEKRVAEGLPGLAIRWGAIEEVDLVDDLQEDREQPTLNGTSPQRMSSCLQQLDVFLQQKQPVVSSMVIAAEKRIEENEENDAKKTDESTPVENEVLAGMKIILRSISNVHLHHEKFLRLRTIEDTRRSEIFLIPGIEGHASVFDGLVPKIKAPATCLQLGIDDYTFDSIRSIADDFSPHLLEKCRDRGKFKIVGYSFGSLIAIELARTLEAEGLNGKLILIDGAPEQTKAIVAQLMSHDGVDDLQSKSLLVMLNVVGASGSQKLAASLRKCQNWQDKVQVFAEICPPARFGLSNERHKVICTAIYKRLAAMINYNAKAIKAKIALLKPTISSLKMDLEDYGLSQITEGPVEVHYVKGNHLTMLDDDKLARIVNEDVLDEENDAFRAKLTA